MIDSNADLILHLGSFLGMFFAGALGIKYKLNGTVNDVKELKEKVDNMEAALHKMDKSLAIIVATCPVCNIEADRSSD